MTYLKSRNIYNINIQSEMTRQVFIDKKIECER